MEPQTTKTWYVKLINSIQSVAEELGLDDVSTARLRTFVTETCKEHWKRGNKSGAAWAFKQARENPAVLNARPA